MANCPQSYQDIWSGHSRELVMFRHAVLRFESEANRDPCSRSILVRGEFFTAAIWECIEHFDSSENRCQLRCSMLGGDIKSSLKVRISTCNLFFTKLFLKHPSNYPYTRGPFNSNLEFVQCSCNLVKLSKVQIIHLLIGKRSRRFSPIH